MSSLLDVLNYSNLFPFSLLHFYLFPFVLSRSSFPLLSGPHSKRTIGFFKGRFSEYWCWLAVITAIYFLELHLALCEILVVRYLLECSFTITVSKLEFEAFYFDGLCALLDKWEQPNYFKGKSGVLASPKPLHSSLGLRCGISRHSKWRLLGKVILFSILSFISSILIPHLSFHFSQTKLAFN